MQDNFNPFAQMQAQSELGRTVLELRPESSAGIRLQVSALAALLRLRVSAEKGDGTWQSIPIDEEIDTALIRQLRTSMYRNGAGTWFGLVLSASSAGEVEVNYNYDEEPAWSFPVDPIAYVTDQQEFPRDEISQPDWLKQRLKEGRARNATRLRLSARQGPPPSLLTPILSGTKCLHQTRVDSVPLNEMTSNE